MSGTGVAPLAQDAVLPAFVDRVLPFDLAAARILAGYPVSEHALDDTLIAATAQAAGMTVVTRNTRHFGTAGRRLPEPADQAHSLIASRSLEPATWISGAIHLPLC